jgi:hypothetical protein
MGVLKEHPVPCYESCHEIMEIPRNKTKEEMQNTYDHRGLDKRKRNNKLASAMMVHAGGHCMHDMQQWKGAPQDSLVKTDKYNANKNHFYSI